MVDEQKTNTHVEAMKAFAASLPNTDPDDVADEGQDASARNPKAKKPKDETVPAQSRIKAAATAAAAKAAAKDASDTDGDDLSDDDLSDEGEFSYPMKDGKVVGPPHSSQRNMRIALRKLGIKLTQNIFADLTFHTRNGVTKELDDTISIRLRLEIERRFKIKFNVEYFSDILIDYAHNFPFHPVREYLEKVQPTWDGKARLENWVVTYLNCEDTPFNRKVGELFFTSAVRRIRSPGCKFDEMVIFEGPQGGLKSTMVETIAGGEEYYSENLDMDADPKIIIEKTVGIWIVECSEMNKFSKASVEHVKGMLSRKVDRSRMAFGRNTKVKPREFIICGTCNFIPGGKPEYLVDLTGNRRFWPLLVGEIDLEKIKADRDQLFAEAATLEASEGYSIRLPKEMWAEAAEVQQSRMAPNPYIDQLTEAFGEREGRVKSTTVQMVLKIEGAVTQNMRNLIGDAMRMLGYRYRTVRIGDYNGKAYIKGDSPHELVAKRNPDTGRFVILEPDPSLTLLQDRLAETHDPEWKAKRAQEAAQIEAEKAAKKAAKDEERAAKRLERQKVRAAERAAKKAAKDAEQAAKKAAKDAERAAKKAAKDTEKIAASA